MFKKYTLILLIFLSNLISKDVHAIFLDVYDQEMSRLVSAPPVAEKEFYKRYKVSISQENDDIRALLSLKSLQNNSAKIAVVQNKLSILNQSSKDFSIEQRGGESIIATLMSDKVSGQKFPLRPNGWSMPISLFTYNQLWLDYTINPLNFNTCEPNVLMEGRLKPFGINSAGVEWAGEGESLNSLMAVDLKASIEGSQIWSEIYRDRFESGYISKALNQNWRIVKEDKSAYPNSSLLSKKFNIRLANPRVLSVEIDELFSINYIDIWLGESKLIGGSKIQINLANQPFSNIKGRRHYYINLQEEINRHYANLFENQKKFKNDIYLKEIGLSIPSSEWELTHIKPAIKIEVKSGALGNEILPKKIIDLGSMKKRMILDLDRSLETGELILDKLNLQLNQPLGVEQCSIKIDSVTLNRVKNNTKIPVYLELINSWSKRMGLSAPNEQGFFSGQVRYSKIIKYIPAYHVLKSNEIFEWDEPFSISNNTILFIGESTGLERAEFHLIKLVLEDGKILELNVKASEPVHLSPGNRKVKSLTIQNISEKEHATSLRDVIFYEISNSTPSDTLDITLPWAKEIPLKIISLLKNENLTVVDNTISGSYKNSQPVNFRTDIEGMWGNVFKINIFYRFGLKQYSNSNCPITAKLIFDRGVIQKRICPKSPIGEETLALHSLQKPFGNRLGRLKSVEWSTHVDSNANDLQENFAIRISLSAWGLESTKNYILGSTIFRVGNQSIEPEKIISVNPTEDSAKFPESIMVVLPKKTSELLFKNVGVLEVMPINPLFDINFPLINTEKLPIKSTPILNYLSEDKTPAASYKLFAIKDHPYVKYLILIIAIFILVALRKKIYSFNSYLKKLEIISFMGFIKKIDKKLWILVIKNLFLVSTFFYALCVLFLLIKYINNFDLKYLILIVSSIQFYIFIFFELCKAKLFLKIDQYLIGKIKIFNLAVAGVMLGWTMQAIQLLNIGELWMLPSLMLLLMNIPNSNIQSKTLYYSSILCMAIWLGLFNYGVSIKNFNSENYFLTGAGFIGALGLQLFVAYLFQLDRFFSMKEKIKSSKFSINVLSGLIALTIAAVFYNLYREIIAEQFVLIGYICFTAELVRLTYLYLTTLKKNGN